MELDIDAVSAACLGRLLDLVVQKVPHIRSQYNQGQRSPPPEQAQHGPPPAKPKKKNKPMGKSEQESKIAQLKQVVGLVGDAGQSAPTAPAGQSYGDSGPGKIMSCKRPFCCDLS